MPPAPAPLPGAVQSGPRARAGGEQGEYALPPVVPPAPLARARWSRPSGTRKVTRKIQPPVPRRTVKDILLDSFRPGGHGQSSSLLGQRLAHLLPLSAEAPAGGQHVLVLPDMASEELPSQQTEGSPESLGILFGAVDLILLLSVVLLLGVGTIMVYSASMFNAFDYHDNVNYYLVRQLMWVAIGCTAMAAAMRIDYRRWRDVSVAGWLITVLLLILVKTSHFGIQIAGAQRWLSLPAGQSIQPSEVAKLGMVIYAAHWLSTRDQKTRASLLGLLPLAVVSAVTLGLVLREPDLGTTAILALTLLSIYFVSGARLRHLALLAAGGAYGLYYMLHAGPTTYWGQRLAAFSSDPYATAQGAGFHIIQAYYALGSGGLSGVGLGNSIEKSIIPAPQTDSIFAILGEELGLVGTLFVLLLFLVFAYRGLRASAHAPDDFGRFVAAGLTCSIFFQAIINMAVMTHLLPFTGVPLPFISFGGSSLAISMAAAGIVLNISKYAAKEGRQSHEPTRPHLRWRHRGTHLSGAPGQPIPFRRPDGARARGSAHR
jgi:cell division protein FtsW